MQSIEMDDQSLAQQMPPPSFYFDSIQFWWKRLRWPAAFVLVHMLLVASKMHIIDFGRLSGLVISDWYTLLQHPWVLGIRGIVYCMENSSVFT